MTLVVVLGFAIAATVAAIAVWITRDRRAPCPRCGTRLEIEPEARAVEAVPGTYSSHLVEAYRCRGCGGEFRQRDHGPLVSLETWNAGDDFPQARIHKRD